MTDPTPDDIKAIARAIALGRGYDPNLIEGDGQPLWKSCARDARAAIAALRTRHPPLAWRPIDEGARSGRPVLGRRIGVLHCRSVVAMAAAGSNNYWLINGQVYGPDAIDAYIPLDPTGLPVGWASTDLIDAARRARIALANVDGLCAADVGGGVVEPGPTHRHYKGGLYRELHRATDEATMLPMVVYQAVADGRLWVRQAAIFDGVVTDPSSPKGDSIVRRFEPIAPQPCAQPVEPVETQDTITAWCDERFPALADPTAELHRRASRILEETVEFAVAAGVTRDRVLEIAGISWDKSAGEFNRPDLLEGELNDILITAIVTGRRRGYDLAEIRAHIRHSLGQRMARNRNRSAEYYAGREAEKLALGLDKAPIAPQPEAQVEPDPIPLGSDMDDGHWGDFDAICAANRPTVASGQGSLDGSDDGVLSAKHVEELSLYCEIGEDMPDDHATKLVTSHEALRAKVEALKAEVATFANMAEAYRELIKVLHITRDAALAREAEAKKTGADELEQALWGIIDRDGLGDVPSDIKGAVGRLKVLADREAETVKERAALRAALAVVATCDLSDMPGDVVAMVRAALASKATPRPGQPLADFLTQQEAIVGPGGMRQAKADFDAHVAPKTPEGDGR